MSPVSEDSTSDFDRLQERTRHVLREPSPDVQANGNRHTDTDFAAVGAAFWDRRESLPRPNSLDISEGEETARHPSQVIWQNRVLSDADAVVAGNRVLSRSPATPTPTRSQLGPYIQPSDMTQIHERRGRRVRRGRRNNPGPRSWSSASTSERRRRVSDTSNDDADVDEEDSELDDRGRSTTPTPYHTPYIPPNYTPSNRSQETEEEHGEGQGPLSPNPWSPSFLYNAQQRHRTEAIAGVDEHFPADQQPSAE